MTPTRAALALLLTFSVVLAGPVPARAQEVGASFSADLSVSVPDAAAPVPDFSFSMGPAIGLVTMTPVTRSNSSATGNASITGSGTAQPGRLSTQLSMNASASQAGNITAAEGDVDARWTDRVTVNAPPGTLVRLRGRLVFTGGVSASPPGPTPESCGPATVFLEASVTLRAIGGFNLSQDTCGSSAGGLDQTMDFEVFAGETFTLDGSLVISLSGSPASASGAPLPAISATADVTSMVFSLDVLTASASLTTSSGVSYSSGSTPAPSVVLTLSGTTFRSGETLTLGIAVENPAGQPETDLYGGALLPDGRTLVFLSGAGGLGGAAVLTNPAGFVPMQVVPPGTTLSLPAFFRFTFPPGSGVPPGPYQLFLALVRRGVLLDNRIDAGDILAIDVKTLTFSP